MALNDQATLVVGSGNYFTAPVGTALPTDLTAPDVAWENVGHTSIEEIMSISSEGGESTVLATLQAAALRTKFSPRIETFNFELQQFDVPGLKLFYGSNAPTLPSGTVGVPAAPVPTQCAFLAIFVDGEHIFAFYAPKAEIFRADDMSIDDTESLAGLPLGVTPLQYNTNTHLYEVTPLGVVATGATAGSPGTYTPAFAVKPANLADLSDVTASPTSAWTTGEYVDLADGTQANWNGTAWEAGVA